MSILYVTTDLGHPVVNKRSIQLKYFPHFWNKLQEICLILAFFPSFRVLLVYYSVMIFLNDIKSV